MPFDGAGLTPRQMLESAALADGIGIVDLGFLEAHKADQIGRHPPGWLYRHAFAVRFGQSFLLIGGAVALDLLGASGATALGIAVALLAFGLAVAPLFLATRGPARWEERLDWDLRQAHPAVRESALRLKQNLPQVRFFTGELFQERVKLDPYLVAEYRGARILLGIWDDERLIFRA